MPERLVDNETGEIVWQLSDGTIIPQSELIQDDDIGKLDTFLINAGMTFADIGRTLRSPFNDREDLALEQRVAQENIQGINNRNPVSAFAGSIAPSLATMPFSGGVGTMAAIGGLEGLAQFRPEASDQLITGASGAVLGGLAQKVMSKIQDAGATARQVARQARERGLPVTVGERLGSRTTRAVETGLEPLPLGATSVRAARQETLNEAANQAMGTTGKKVTEESFEESLQQTGDVFREVAGSIPSVQMGEEFGERFRTISSKFSKAAKLNKWDGLKEGGNGMLKKGDYLQIRQTLADYGYSQAGTGNPLSKTALDMVEDLDNALAEKAGPEIVERFGRAREQYRMMKILQRGGTVGDGEDVSAAMLRTGLRQNLDQTFFTGGGVANQALKNPETENLVQLTRLLNKPELTPTVGNSGTAERLIGTLAAGGTVGAVASGNLPLAGGIVAGGVGGTALNALLGSQTAGEIAEFAARGLAPRAAGGSRAVNQALLDQIMNPDQR